MFATTGKNANTFEKFAKVLQAHGGCARSITEIGKNLLSTFPEGAADQHLLNAQITFDRFRLIKYFNEGVDVVQRSEALSQPHLKASGWLWFKNPGIQSGAIELSQAQWALLVEGRPWTLLPALKTCTPTAL